MRITLENYLMGRETLYPEEYTTEVRQNAEQTVGKVNALLAVLEAEGVPVESHPNTLSPISSGWRPPQVNTQVKGAKVRSKHMAGQAGDLYDPEGEIDDWLMSDAGQRALTAIGLWLEHPSATKGWSHVQTIPPRSGKRVFYP